jgi:small conductance mechanosensitive channel
MEGSLEASINSIENLGSVLADTCTEAAIRIVIAVIIYFAGRFVISKILKGIGKLKGFGKLDETARSYILTFIRAVLHVALIVSIIAQLGVPMSSVIAVIASAGVAIGMAMQGSLANIAGGIMLLIFRPFNVGDYILAGGEEGTVKSISTFYTVLTTVDNKTVSIPNGTLMNSNITNCSMENLRRVDLSFNIAGSEPIKKVQATIMKVVVATDKAMASPAPEVQPLAPVPGGLEYTVRVWCKTSDYWDVYFELMREIPSALNSAEISGPSTPVKVG